MTGHPTTYSRRQFLGAVGAGGVATTGLTRRATAQGTPVVEMANNYFDPVGMWVAPGTTVRFEIAAGVHSATAYPDRVPSDATAFDSGVLSTGRFEHTFETPGTYDYFCIPHESVGMVGRIVVASPGGPAEDSPVPHGAVPDSETIVERGTVAYGAATDGDGATRDGMMGPGMMGGRTHGRSGGVAVVAGALGVLGAAGGVLYWALRRASADSERDDPAMATLRRRYARGDVDEEEFRRCRERLVSRETDDAE